MKTIAALSGKSRRRHMHLARDIRANGALIISPESEQALGRMALRLHRAGLLVLGCKGDLVELHPTIQALSASGQRILPGSPLR